MALIKYCIKENKAVGTHSFYAQAVSYSVLDTKDLAEEVSEGTGITPPMVVMLLDRYADVVQRNVLRGHRVKLGNTVVFYPQITASVKDEVDKDGKVTKVATADMLTLTGAKSTIGATVSQSVQQKFSANVQWKRIDEDSAKEGNTPDDGTTGGNTPGGSGTNPTTPSGGSGSTSSSGSND